MQREAVHRRAGTVSNAVFVTVPVLHRVTACRNAPGTRGAFHVSNPCFMMFMAHSLFSLVSRTRCSAERCIADAGTMSTAAFATIPVLHRVTSCRNAPGTCDSLSSSLVPRSVTLRCTAFFTPRLEGRRPLFVSPSFEARRRSHLRMTAFFKPLSYRTAPSRRCRSGAARPPRRPRWDAGRSSSATRSSARRFSIPSFPVRRSADWPPCR